MTLTASIGVATAETSGDLRALTKIADQRLYEAKRAGRDRVFAYRARLEPRSAARYLQ
jgi:diguanylate cyclase (GGDEF)-like protein